MLEISSLFCSPACSPACKRTCNPEPRLQSTGQDTAQHQQVEGPLKVRQTQGAPRPPQHLHLARLALLALDTGPPGGLAHLQVFLPHLGVGPLLPGLQQPRLHGLEQQLLDDLGVGEELVEVPPDAR